jgi:hypothetical protein
VNRVNPWSPLKKSGGSRIFSVVKRFGSPRKNSITESYTELPSGEPDALGYAISLEQLGQGKKSVALSADFRRIVFWTKKNLGVISRPDTEMALIPMEGSDLIIASRNYCAIVRRYIDHDEVRIDRQDSSGLLSNAIYGNRFGGTTSTKGSTGQCTRSRLSRIRLQT